MHLTILAPWDEDAIALSFIKLYSSPKPIDETTDDVVQEKEMIDKSTVGITQRISETNQKPLWCFFHGITCRSNSTDLNFGTIDTIVLDDLGLTGRFPTYITSFAQMTSFSMKNNNLMGSIPSSIGAMSSLTSLRLSNNQLIGTIPQSMMSLPSLAHLDLSNNFLSGVVPPLDLEGHLKYVNVGMNYLVDYSYGKPSQQSLHAIRPVRQKRLESMEYYSTKTVSNSVQSNPVLVPSKLCEETLSS